MTKIANAWLGGVACVLAAVSIAAAEAPTERRMPVPPAPVTAPAWTAIATVRAVDAGAGTMTLAHRRIGRLGLPAGTTTFHVREPAFLEQVRPGQRTRFSALRVDGSLVVTHLGLDVPPRRR